MSLSWVLSASFADEIVDNSLLEVLQLVKVEPGFKFKSIGFTLFPASVLFHTTFSIQQSYAPKS